MNIPWEMLFELISKLIEMCLAEGRRESDIRTALANPGGIEWWAVWRQLGKEGIRGQERRAYMRRLQEESRKVSGAIIDELIEDAKLNTAA